MEAAEKLYFYGRNHWRTGRGYLYSDNNPEVLFDAGYKEYVTVVTYTVWQEIGLDVDYLRENDHIIWTKIDTDPSKVMPDMYGRTTGLDEDRGLLSTMRRMLTASSNSHLQDEVSVQRHLAQGGVPTEDDYRRSLANKFQRMFWATGAEIGYSLGTELTWYLLMHSLERYPEPVVIEEGVSNLFDDVIEKIKNNTYFQEKLDEYLQDKAVSFSMVSTEGLNFANSGDFDLKSAIKKCELWFSGAKNEDGSWNLEIELRDRYDFTDLQNPFFKTIEVEQPKLGRTDTRWKIRSKGEIFAWSANNLAHYSQEWDTIRPFDVKIRFTLRNYEVKKVWLSSEEWKNLLGGFSQELLDNQ